MGNYGLRGIPFVAMGTPNPSPHSPATLEQLLSHSDWVRALARRLVSDTGLADDLVQDTWATAVTRPPRARENLRGWLGTVLRNHARQLNRGMERRSRREQLAAEGEALPSAAELVSKAAMQREVVGQVLKLAEPLRIVILLRFFEDQTTSQIARSLQIPVQTVHNRLLRAIEILRNRMDENYGCRDSWCIPLLPLCGKPQGASSVAAWTLPRSFLWTLMQTPLKFALLIPLLALLAWFSWTSLSQGHAQRSDLGHVPSEEASLRETSPPVNLEVVENPVQRNEVASETLDSQRAKSNLEASVETWDVHGRVVDPRGRGLSGIAVIPACKESVASAISGPDGSFAIELDPAICTETDQAANSIRLGIVDDAWTTLRETSVSRDNLEGEIIIVAAPTVQLHGTVLQRGGAPIKGAMIALPQFNWALFGFPHNLENSVQVGRSTHSDSNGTFRIAQFPYAQGLSIYIGADGFESKTIVLGEHPEPIVIELEKSGDVEGLYFHGVVLTHVGAVANAAKVRLGPYKTTADQAGLFRLRYDGIAPEFSLCASHKDALPALIPSFGSWLEGRDLSQPVELRLGTEPLSIKGRVLDPTGLPLKDWIVSIQDETTLSRYRLPIESAEGLVRKGSREAQTNPQGKFILDGLYSRNYELLAFDPVTLQRVQGVASAGSQDVVLRADMQWIDSLAGRVVGQRGEGLLGISVQLQTKTYVTHFGHNSATGSSAHTDEAGSFEFDKVPTTGCHLYVSGEGILSEVFELEEALEGPLAVTRRCPFRIELSRANHSIDEVEFLDSNGKSLQVNFFTATGMAGYNRAKIENGKSQPLSVSEQASTAVLYANGEELSRQPIHLDPKKNTLLQL